MLINSPNVSTVVEYLECLFPFSGGHKSAVSVVGLCTLGVSISLTGIDDGMDDGSAMVKG